MKTEFYERIALNSTLLGSLLSKLDEDSLGSVNDMLKDKTIKKFLNDAELIQTVEAFFENNLNLTKTSKSLIVHRNTLLYRIEKIKKMLGLDIRNFEDAVTIETLLILKRFEVKRKRQANKTIRLESLTKNLEDKD